LGNIPLLNYFYFGIALIIFYFYIAVSSVQSSKSIKDDIMQRVDNFCSDQGHIKESNNQSMFIKPRDDIPQRDYICASYKDFRDGT
jgi:hypothetical protein